MTKVGIAIVECLGHYLVGYRQADQSLPGYREFPGGKQIVPESTSETAVRECLEETGLRVSALDMLHQQSFEYDDGEVQLDFWRCQVQNNMPHLLPEIVSPWEWVHAEQLSSLNFPPANAVLLTLLQQQKNFQRSEY